MTRDVRLYIEDIAVSLAAIVDYLEGMDEDRFLASRLVQDGVLRRLEVIGEAAKNVPEEVRRSHPDIPWQRMAGMRDVLIHNYFGVNLHRVWETATSAVPSLLEDISAIIDDRC